MTSDETATLSNQTESSAPAPIDWGKSLHFFQADPAWLKKLLMGGLFALLTSVLVGSFFLAGYLSRLIAQVARGDDDHLPEWSEFGGLFVDGAKALGVYLVLTLPLALIPTGLSCVISLVMPLLASRREAVGSADAQAWAALLAMGGMMLMMLVFVAALYALMFYLPAALTRLAVTGRFADGLAVRKNLAFIRRNLGGYLLSLLLYLAAGALSMVGYLACCVGIFVTSFWSVCVLSWCLGAVARRDPELGALSASAR
jgi:hypothetical protein